jgi:hypothetical protein
MQFLIELLVLQFGCVQFLDHSLVLRLADLQFLGVLLGLQFMVLGLRLGLLELGLHGHHVKVLGLSVALMLVEIDLRPRSVLQGP